MEVDLKQDARNVRTWIERRVKSLGAAAKGRQMPPVSSITLGFQYDQAGWVSLFIDQRESGKRDGAWTQHIERNMIQMPQWLQAYEALDHEELVFRMPDGSSMAAPAGIPEESYAAIFGDMLKGVLLAAKADGLFDLIPKRQDCELRVEEIEGRYGWPVHEARRKENLA